MNDKLFHCMKSGEKIRISKMTTSHLKNTINLIKRKAESGLTLSFGSCYWGDMYYDEEVIYGDEVLNVLHISRYTEELQKRVKNLKQSGEGYE